MKILLWPRHEGPTDGQFKDGDIFRAYPDTYVPGAMETKRWVCLQIDDYTGPLEELESSEYGINGNNEPEVRMMRKYRIDYATKLTPDELAAARNPSQEVPVIVGRFKAADILRK